jgi:hypothetical protein
VEVVLLWLDDLDDLVFTVALTWELIRRLLLQIGLAAAVGLATCELSVTAIGWVPALAAIAAASVAAWLGGSLLRAAYYRELRRFSAAA